MLRMFCGFLLGINHFPLNSKINPSAVWSYVGFFGCKFRFWDSALWQKKTGLSGQTLPWMQVSTATSQGTSRGLTMGGETMNESVLGQPFGDGLLEI